MNKILFMIVAVLTAVNVYGQDTIPNKTFVSGNYNFDNYEKPIITITEEKATDVIIDASYSIEHNMLIIKQAFNGNEVVRITGNYHLKDSGLIVTKSRLIIEKLNNNKEEISKVLVRLYIWHLNEERELELTHDRGFVKKISSIVEDKLNIAEDKLRYAAESMARRSLDYRFLYENYDPIIFSYIYPLETKIDDVNEKINILEESANNEYIPNETKEKIKKEVNALKQELPLLENSLKQYKEKLKKRKLWQG